MTMSIPNSLQTARRIAANRLEHGRELKAQGLRPFGYLCLYPPIEILTAAGFVPYRIFGETTEPVTEGDRIISSTVCPFLRSIVDLGMKGKYDFLDGLVGAHTCDIGCMSVHLWHDYVQEPAFTFFIDVPHTDHEPAVTFFYNQLSGMKNAIETYAKKKITDADLAAASAIHNEQRRLMRKVYDLSKGSPSPISGSDLLSLATAASILPVSEGNELLSSTLAEVTATAAGKKDDPLRIMIWGSLVDDISLYGLIESLGAKIVIDDTCTGTRGFTSDVTEDGDPLRALAQRYLVDIRCPRTYRQSGDATLKRDYAADTSHRFSYLLDFAKEWKVDGIIIVGMKYCDSHGFDFVHLKDFLASNGLAHHFIEYDYTMDPSEQWKNRIEAFFETLR